MKQLKHIVAMAVMTAATALLTACSGEDSTIPAATSVPITVVATIEDTGWGTRASESSFEKDDRIGISGNYQQNVPYTYNGSSWSSASTLYFNDMYETFTAYYPYSQDIDSGMLTDTKDYLYSRATPVSIYDNGSQTEVKFSFRHVMCRLSISFDNANVTSFTVVGLKQSGEFNVRSGEAKATGNATNLTAENGLTDKLIFPQTSELIVIYTLNGTRYLATINPASGFVSGYSYSYTIQTSDNSQ